MKLLVLSCAEDEFAEVVDYYNDQCPGLGYEFAVEVQRAFERIRNHPRAWPKFSARTRRCLTDRFPFGILYENYEDRIIIGGIMHLNPDYSRKMRFFVNNPGYGLPGNELKIERFLGCNCTLLFRVTDFEIFLPFPKPGKFAK